MGSGRPWQADFDTATAQANLCRDIDSFSLHARVRIAAHEHDGLERLCRPVARPPFKAERLPVDYEGRVICALCRHWHGGSSAVVFEPLDFIARPAKRGSPGHKALRSRGPFHGATPCTALPSPSLPLPR